MTTSPSLDELRDLAPLHPVAWAMYASQGRWQRAPHLMWLADRVMALFSGEIKRLCVSMPPRHGKSEFISKFLPTWWLGVRPESRIALCSYGERLTVQWSRAGRDLFAEHAPAVFGVDTWSRSSVTDWHVFREGRRTGGGLFAVGKGGSLTGRGADLLICDDLVKDDAEARNPTLREHAWDWFLSVPMTRLEPNAAAIVVMTRWHHDDVIGRIVAQQERGEAGEPWEVVNLPALADEGDPLGREPGGPLWPERFDREALERIRRDVGPYVWEALYQGRPTPVEGSLFRREWLRYYTRERDGELLVCGERVTLTRGTLLRFVTVDLAASTRSSADYTVMAVWGVDVRSRTLVLLDVERVRLEGPDITPRLREVMERNDARVAYVESIGYQLHLIQQARRDGLAIREVRPDADKVSRALPATAAMQAGELWVPRSASWLPAWESELLTFPHGAHDDQVDALAYGVRVYHDLLNYLRGAGGATGGRIPIDMP